MRENDPNNTSSFARGVKSCREVEWALKLYCKSNDAPDYNTSACTTEQGSLCLDMTSLSRPTSLKPKCTFEIKTNKTLKTKIKFYSVKVEFLTHGTNFNNTPFLDMLAVLINVVVFACRQTIVYRVHHKRNCAISKPFRLNPQWSLLTEIITNNTKSLEATKHTKRACSFSTGHELSAADWDCVASFPDA